MAFLILKPSITKATTVLGYAGHVKYFFREHGCDDMEYKTPFLAQLRRGIQNTYPKQANKRTAFLLPHFVKTSDFLEPGSKPANLVRVATVCGFIGMLRPHTFTQLQPSSFSFVLKNEQVLQPPVPITSFRKYLNNLPKAGDMLGFYVTFKSKTMPVARAYFPNLRSSCSALSVMYPLSMLLAVAKMDWIHPNFLKRCGRGDTLGKYLKLLANSEDPVSPYALRIGGRTWYISHGMDRQFCDYLGTWKSPESSARYYRASPATVLRKLLRFYDRMKTLDEALGNF